MVETKAQSPVTRRLPGGKKFIRCSADSVHAADDAPGQNATQSKPSIRATESCPNRCLIDRPQGFDLVILLLRRGVEEDQDVRLLANDAATAAPLSLAVEQREPVGKPSARKLLRRRSTTALRGSRPANTMVRRGVPGVEAISTSNPAPSSV